MRLEGRVAIVTGSGRNIGEGIATAFAREGARVGVVDVVEERAEAVAAAINAAMDGSALAIGCDVTSGEQVQRMVEQVVGHWGGVDILVNNVGVVDRQNVLELPEAEWDRVIGVSLKSVFLCTKYAALRMVAQGRGGRIVNIASTSGHRGRDNATAYPSAKGGVLNLTRALAVQLGPHGIRVNSITPNPGADGGGAGGAAAGVAGEQPGGAAVHAGGRGGGGGVFGVGGGRLRHGHGPRGGRRGAGERLEGGLGALCSACAGVCRLRRAPAYFDAKIHGVYPLGRTDADLRPSSAPLYSILAV